MRAGAHPGCPPQREPAERLAPRAPCSPSPLRIASALADRLCRARTDTGARTTLGLERHWGSNDKGDSMLKDFKAFILRGNVVDLAVAVVIGAAFGAVVTSFVKNLLTPLISIPGKATFSNLFFKVNGSTF